VISTFAGTPNQPLAAAQNSLQFVFDPDPSLLAAHLLGALAAHHDLRSLGAGGAYLTGDRLVDQHLLQSFAVQDVLPLRTAVVAAHLAARGIGCVEIKKRGVSVNPERFRRELKLRGDNEATLVLTRVGKREMALVCRRMPEDQGLNEPLSAG
jgi:hypothetical protein